MKDLRHTTAIVLMGLALSATATAKPLPNRNEKGVHASHSDTVTGVIRHVKCVKGHDGAEFNIVDIRTKEGKVIQVRSSATPWITRNGKRIPHSDLKTGETIVAKGHPMMGVLHADDLQVVSETAPK